MAHNLTFESTPAASVSLACCQSLCDLLRELPLPSAAHVPNACLSSRAVNHQNLAVIHTQLEAALSLAKNQLAELVFTAETTPTTSAAMSPLALQMSMKGLFGFGQQNNSLVYESNSLETIEPSLKTSLGFDDSLKLIDDCLQNDADVKYFPATETTEDYSSLGDRVKSRRQHNNSEATHRRHDDVLVPTPPPPPPPPPVVNNVVVDDRTHDRRDDRRDDRRHERTEKKKEKAKEQRRERDKTIVNHNDFQSKDSSATFESIVSRLMSDSVDRDDDDSDDNDDRNDMSFDLRIDTRELNHLMSLSSKLKHSNKAKDLESKLGSKLTSFLSLLTNKMIVWFSKFKETDDQTTADDRETTGDDNVFWQQLINASKMSLNLMTAQGMSSRVVLFEELLEIIVNFLSFNLNSRTHVTSKSPSKKKASQLVTSASKRQVTHWTELLELLSEYLAQNKGLNDSLVLMVTRSSMSALFLNASELQLVAITCLTHVFQNYPKHRNSVLEDLLNQFHRIPCLKSPKGGQQSALTRLLSSLTTCLFGAHERLTKESASKQLTECLAVISAFLSSFVKKCLSGSSADVDLKALFDAFLSDLLQSLHFPQSISSLLLIQILTKLLVTNLAQNNKTAALQLKLASVEFLANICAKFGQLLSQKDQIQEESLKTLDQLLGADDTRRQLDQRLEDVLRMLNHFLVSEKLMAEKVILCALWSKEQRVLDLGDKFFAVFSNNKTTDDDSDDTIDATTALLLIKSLELNVFSTVARLFDASLSHVTSSLSLTTNTTLRSRAMKSLSQILSHCTLEKSTQLLRRNDLQVAMRSALLDASTSVREATVDLIGRFVLQSKSLELCEKYAELIGERVLDTGVSVRKRVIKILRDVCVAFPAFDRCGEIQLRIIKRANDEGEGIRKLVLETVRDLWFRHVTHEDVAVRVNSLLHVIRVMLQSEGQIDSLATLFEQIVKGEEALECAQLIADHVVSAVLVDAAAEGRQRALQNLAAMTLVALLSSICPELLTKHVDSLQSLLSLSCDSLVDIHLQKKLIQSLERILRKVANPSPALLCRLEEDLCKQILQSSALILPNCVKCLAVVIEEHTQNEKLAVDLFSKFQLILLSSQDVVHNKPKLLRAVYSLGLFLKHFAKRFHSKDAIIDAILALIHRNQCHNGQSLAHADLVVCCLTALGFIVEADPRVCLRPTVFELYSRVLRAGEQPQDEQLCKQALTNFCNYLSESMATDEEVNKQIEWARESLKHMTSDEDVDSNSIQSQIIQQYLPLLLQNSLAPSPHIRRVACNVVHVIQTGGHVHPLQLVPHLIAMTTDDDATIRSRADHVLHEIERKFHGFVAMKAKAGIELAQQLCARLRCRGFRLLDDSSGDVTSRLATLYHVICTNRQSRRGFIQQLLRSFEVTTVDDTLDDTIDDEPLDDQTTDRTQLMFEMVLFFPFSVCDEVCYILQQLECIQSVNATHCAQLFKELLGFASEEEMDDKFDDNYELFAQEVREERAELVLCKTQLIRRVYLTLKKVFVVAFLRRLLKEFYLLKDEKILEYSPNEPKVWEKPIHRRHIETTHLHECLLRANPSPNLLSRDVAVDDLLEELQRFKSVALTSSDLKISSQWIQQKLFTQQKPKAVVQSVTMETRPDAPSATPSDLNDEQRRRLLESIRRTSCQVALVDIGTQDPRLLQPKRGTENKEKKKKRRRVRIESDSESESGSESEFR